VRKPKKIRAVRPNAGLEAWLRRRIEREVDDLAASVEWWVGAAYRKEQPRIASNPVAKSNVAQDAAPADILQRVLESLRRRWGQRFDALGEEIAAKFATRAGTNTDDAVEAAMRAAGMRVKLQPSKAQRDQLAGTIQENVSLIRSIAPQYFTSVEGAVMRSVLAGRDLGTLTSELKRAHGVTHRRAAFIARDQNNKATAYFTKTRQLELGIQEAIWVHSGAGKEPRPSHLKAGREGVVYNVAEGWLDPHLNKRIWPGTEPNCRCTCRSVIAVPKQQELAA
jgi:SPP1 gp7 family putative phage head morphogenesis protein